MLALFSGLETRSSFALLRCTFGRRGREAWRLALAPGKERCWLYKPQDKYFK